jgi:crotonobetainyl-CoA:carnitine CoA-transferase CaiB-like acyl-CoA transferase
MSVFEGIKVVDLSQALAGPLATMLLGDMGADVIKVEPPGLGDHSRGFTPDWNGEGCTYLTFNRNKRSVSIDLKKPRGQEIALELIKDADVFVESFRTGTIDRLGLGYERVASVNPGIVYCSVSAFGRTGPMASRAGYDVILQAHGGLMKLTGEADRPSVRVGYSVVDLFAGIQAYGTIVTALYQRQQTGRGQLVEASLLESIVQMMSYHATTYLATGRVPTKHGAHHPNIAPSNVFSAADGEFVLAAATPKIWRGTCEVLGRPDLADDPRFSSNPKRVENRPELNRLLDDIFATRTAAEWVDAFNEAGVPSAKLNDVSEVVNDPQVAARELIVPVDHPQVPGLRVPGCPLKLADSPATVRRYPPRLGEHTNEILGQLGYSEVDLDSLGRDGVVYQWTPAKDDPA